jgi:hypothetical protein
MLTSKKFDVVDDALLERPALYFPAAAGSPISLIFPANLS